MKYDISKRTAPEMPTLGKGTECIKILLTQASKDMHEPLVPMLFPILGAHLSASEFQYPDLTWKEICGQMANLVAESGGNKGQLSHLTEAICRNMRQHDEEEYRKLVNWQKQMKTKAANKEKPERPDVAFWMPPADLTNAAFLQNAMALEALGGRIPRLGRFTDEFHEELGGYLKRLDECKGRFIIKPLNKLTDRLTLWIRRCEPLRQQLESMGYSSTCKAFTPREIRAIVNHLGPP